MERVRKAYAEGRASAEDLAQAEQNLVTSARLYRDALEDQRRSIEARKSVAQSELDVMGAGTRLAIEQQKRIEQLARARGDEATAIRAANTQRQLEIRLAELAAAAKRLEAEAAISFSTRFKFPS